MPSLDLPECLLRATKLSWTQEANHGIAESPFSGHIQSQRGRLERWSFTMDIQRMTRRDAQQAIAFFLQLEGPLGTFRMHDPAACKPLGKGTGLPVASTNTPAGSRTLPTTGWAPNVPIQLLAGDWVQIGDQLSRVRSTVGSAADGSATLDLWPKLMLPVSSGTPITLRPARGHSGPLGQIGPGTAGTPARLDRSAPGPRALRPAWTDRLVLKTEH